MPQIWRLASEIVAPGATQMALDAWLLDQLIAGQAKPTLRFYRWQPIALSLGYHQKRWPEHWRALSWQGQPVELVRRPTGGRAVLHQGDFTYAVTMPMRGNRCQDLYKRICGALILAWKHLGVSLSYGTAGRGYRNQSSCFALATAADLVTPTGYKLIGNAQLRRDRALLQHGTMRLWPSRELYAQVFQEEMSIAPIPSVIPAHPSSEWLSQLSELIAGAIEHDLGVTFENKPFISHEQKSAHEAYARETIP